MQERLAKVLGAAGVASRRDAEVLIESGKVSVNGQVVREPGHKVDPDSDYIRVSGRALPRNVERLYILLNKPRGYVTTREDPHATHTVMQLVLPALQERMGRNHPAVQGLHPVGRLDTQTEGLLILTNDGELTNALTHPRHQVPKLYVAEVRGIPDDAALAKMRTGVPLFGRRTLPARVRIAREDRTSGKCTVEVELKEGRNQQVRRMLQAVGYPVDKLTRVSVGPVTLQRLKPGQWRHLTKHEVEGLLRIAAHPEENASAASPGSGAAPRKHRYQPGYRPPERKRPPEAPPTSAKPSGPAGKRRAPLDLDAAETPIPPRRPAGEKGRGEGGPRRGDAGTQRRSDAGTGRRDAGTQGRDAARDPRTRDPRAADQADRSDRSHQSGGTDPTDPAASRRRGVGGAGRRTRGRGEGGQDARAPRRRPKKRGDQG